jgi:RNA polymerase sigma factor (sigma-70 family)
MDLNKIDDALLQACIQRNKKAEYELYKVTYSYLMSICVRYTGDEESAKEVLNLGFLKILNNLSKYHIQVPFKAWIRKIMINTLINEYKKEKIHYERHHYNGEYYETAQYSELNQAITKINVDDVYALIAKLPSASKQVFNLYCIDGFKHNEIADMLNISEGTSKWHLNAAREKLKTMLSEMNIIQKVVV